MQAQALFPQKVCSFETKSMGSAWKQLYKESRGGDSQGMRAWCPTQATSMR